MDKKSFVELAILDKELLNGIYELVKDSEILKARVKKDPFFILFYF